MCSAACKGLDGCLRGVGGGGVRSSAIFSFPFDSKHSVEIPGSQPALERNLLLGGELQDKAVLGRVCFLNLVLKLQHMLIHSVVFPLALLV